MLRSFQRAGCTPFYKDLHRNFVESLDKDKETLEYLMNEHLRMGGVFWGLGVLDLMKTLSIKTQEKENDQDSSNQRIQKEDRRKTQEGGASCGALSLSLQTNKTCDEAITREDANITQKCISVRGYNHTDTDEIDDLTRTAYIEPSKVIKWIQSCWDEKTGGYGSNYRHDAHITSTLVCDVSLRIE